MPTARRYAASASICSTMARAVRVEALRQLKPRALRSQTRTPRGACPAGAGGALSLERSSVQLEQSTLEANTAGSGGAISISERAQNLATPLIRNVTFVANTAAAPASRGYIAASSSVKGEGGATYLSSAGTIRVEQSTFDSNRGKSGGALAAMPRRRSS